MALTFTNFLATATRVVDQVAQEPVGFLDAITFLPSVEGANVGQTVNIGNPAPVSGGNWTPVIRTALPSAVDENGRSLTIDKARKFEFSITGEQLNGLNVGNPNAMRFMETKMAEAVRSARNEVDAHVAVKAKEGASRATGTAATTPFASNMDATSILRRIAGQNGMPMDGNVSLVLSPAAAENARKLLGSVTAAGGSLTAEVIRSGGLPSHNGFQLRESVNIATHTAGTAASYQADDVQAAGSIFVDLKTGTGTLLPGDVIHFAVDTGVQYVVTQGLSEPGTIRIARPGLLTSVANNNALTLSAAYTPNIALHRDSVIAVVRPPAQADVMEGGQPFAHSVVVDPVSGMPYGLYVQVFDGGVLVSIQVCFGVIVGKQEFAIILRG